MPLPQAARAWVLRCANKPCGETVAVAYCHPRYRRPAGWQEIHSPLCAVGATHYLCPTCRRLDRVVLDGLRGPRDARVAPGATGRTAREPQGHTRR